MPLFKYVYNTSSTDQADALKRYCSAFQPSMSWTNLLPIVEDAELTYVKPYIGEDFYNELLAAYEAGTMTAAQTTMVRLLQRSIAWFSFYDALISLAITMSDMGPGESVDKDGTFLFPRQWVSNTGRAQAFRKAGERMDEALKYLEKNAASYPTWLNDTEIQEKTRGLFFNSAEQLAEYLPTKVSRIVYLTLQPAIKEAERRYILPTIGKDLMDELKAALQDVHTTPLSSDQEELLSYIRQALAKWALLCAVPALRLQLNDQGLVEPSFDFDQKTRPAREETTRSLWISFTEAGRIFLYSLKTWLDENAALFPTYLASSAYQNTIPQAKWLDQEREDGSDYPVVSLL